MDRRFRPCVAFISRRIALHVKLWVPVIGSENLVLRVVLSKAARVDTLKFIRNLTLLRYSVLAYNLPCVPKRIVSTGLCCGETGMENGLSVWSWKRYVRARIEDAIVR